MRPLLSFATGVLVLGCADDTALRPVPSASAAPTAPPAMVGDGGPLPEKLTEYRGTLDLDIVSTAQVHLIEHADGALDVELDLGRGGGAFDPMRHLTTTGKVSRFLEADTTLYSATLGVPASLGGRCGSLPVSLALALRRVGANDHVSGAVTAYCGANRWYGAPAQVLRLTGALPVIAP